MAGRLAETAKMVAELDLKTGKFTKGVGTAVGSLGKLTGAVAKSRAVAVGVGVGLERLAETGIRALSGAIETGIQGALTLEKAQAQTQAAITSTGNAAGQTVDSIRALAQAQEDLTTADDKTIQQGENLLLTFTRIGSTVFPEATAQMVNFAIAMNKGDAATADFDGAAIKLGKALNDPIKGLTALSKSGVTFSVAQADQIKKLAGQGNALKDLTTAHVALSKEQKAYIKDLGSSVGPLTAARKAGVKLTKGQEAMLKTIEDGSGLIAAQKIILAELAKEFGEAGKAAGTGFQADINRANDAIEDAQITIAQGLMPALGEVARELATTFRDQSVINGLKDLGTGIGDVIKGGVAFAKTVPWGTIASSLRTAAGFAKDLLNAFLGLPTWVQTAVITGWGLNKLSGGLLTDVIGELGKGLIKGVLGMNAAVVNINAGVVNGVGGLPGGGLPGAVPGVAAGAAGLGLGAAAALVIAPASIAALGVAFAKATDPLGKKQLAGQAATASARGIPDWNNKALIQLQKLGGIESATRQQTDSIDVLKREQADQRAAIQAGAIKSSTAAYQSGLGVQAAIRASRPITNVDVRVSATTVQKSVNVVTRYGPIGGDRYVNVSRPANRGPQE